MVKKSAQKNTPKAPLSTQRKVLFYAITFSIPVLFFVMLEVVLQGIDYKGNNALFVDPNIPNKEYLIPNPNFASRYFFYTKTVPNPSTDVFLQKKPSDGFRVFAMGGSSAAGYPYGFNGTYSRVVKDVLTDALPNRTVEVVNVGISAISSYTLFDQVDEIIEQQPDAVLIYAGHNEFYGALGVGSNEKLGGFPGFVRFYLKLQRFKTFMLLRTIIVDSGKWIGTTLGTSEYDETATLMERIVDSRSIELGSPKYELAMVQRESNLRAIVENFEDAGIPVYIGSVASNLKDHPPFVDIPKGEQPSALQAFNDARSNFEEGNFKQALELFELARDLDGLKFRAPSQINKIIADIAEEEDVNYVPVEENMAASIEDGIIGFELMLEHLHPNQQGYFLIGRSFAQTLLADLNVSEQALPKPLDNYLTNMRLTEFDERIAYHRVRTLKQGFPFVLGEKPEPYQYSYKVESVADSMAFQSVQFNKSWDEAKVELAQYYEQTGQFDQAIDEYYGLIRNQPWNDSPYLFAARIFLDNNDFTNAEPLLEKAYEIFPTEAFTTKMLGAIMVQKGNPKRGIRLLEESRALNPNDPQMLYNLSGAYGTDLQFDKALEIAREVQQISPNFPGINGWVTQLQILINK